MSGSSNCLPPSLTLSRSSLGLFVTLQEILYHLFFALIRLLQKIMHFQSKIKFFLSIYGFWFWFCCFAYVFPRVLFHCCSIMKLKIASNLNICIASYLASQQIMWYNRRIHGHDWKITSCCCFFSFQENYIWGCQNVNKELFRYCNLQHTKPYKSSATWQNFKKFHLSSTCGKL